jgi:hypothetical protein
MEGKKAPEEQEECLIPSMRRDRIKIVKRVAAVCLLMSLQEAKSRHSSRRSKTDADLSRKSTVRS